MHGVLPWETADQWAPIVPLRSGQAERRTHDYVRHGTTTLFAALNANTTEVITQFHHRYRSAQFREFLDVIDARVPKSLDVHIIMDNYGTAKPRSFGTGLPSGRASTSTTLRRTARGSTSSSAGLPS
jgi:hypothetical protein